KRAGVRLDVRNLQAPRMGQAFLFVPVRRCAVETFGLQSLDFGGDQRDQALRHCEQLLGAVLGVGHHSSPCMRRISLRTTSAMPTPPPLAMASAYWSSSMGRNTSSPWPPPKGPSVWMPENIGCSISAMNMRSNC